MLKVIDQWLCATLFAPIIIWVCQQLGCTQHQFHRYGWAISTLFFAALHMGSLFGVLFYGILGLAMVISAVLSDRDKPTFSAGWLRALIVVLIINDILFVAMATNPDSIDSSIKMIVVKLILLASEYAALIATIPPRDRKYKKSAQSVS